MKILRSTIRKGGSPLLDVLVSSELGHGRTKGQLLPCHCTLHSSSVTKNRRLCYVLQLMSLLIISSTLIVYQAAISRNPDRGGSGSVVEIEILGNMERGLVVESVNEPKGNNIEEVKSAIIKSSETTTDGLPATGEKLDNVFLSVKSTKRFHSSRLQPIVKTWLNLARDQVSVKINLSFIFHAFVLSLSTEEE